MKRILMKVGMRRKGQKKRMMKKKVIVDKKIILLLKHLMTLGFFAFLSLIFVFFLSL